MKLDYFKNDGFMQPLGITEHLLTEPTPEANAPEDAAGWSPLEVTDTNLPEGERTQLTLHQGPIGEWLVGVDDMIRRAWKYPPELLALGITGKVVVEFQVSPNGAISSIQVVYADPIDLTASALEAIPNRTAPLPNDARYRKGYRLRYTFLYRKAPS
jgi:TonB family protein